MAEASSSGGEGSEEEDSDEASPSDGVITAASPRPPRHINKRKKLRYVQDYLPKHQRRRIQKEIDKGYKPGEIDCFNTCWVWLSCYHQPQIIKYNTVDEVLISKVNKGEGRVLNCAYPRANTVYKVTWHPSLRMFTWDRYNRWCELT